MTGHHVYKVVWTSVIEQVLHLEAEDGNQHDKYPVAVMKNDQIIGHAPRCISRVSWYFLKNGGEIKCKITSKRKKGNGLEVLCIYIYKGPPRIACRLSRLVL